MKAIKGFTPDMYLAWLLGQTVPLFDARELVNEYKKTYNKGIQKRMVNNFKRKITRLRARLVDTTDPVARKHIRSSAAILEVELSTWK